MICPALFDVGGEIRTKKDSEATNYDLEVPEEGPVQATTTVWYNVEWWPPETKDTLVVARFELACTLDLSNALLLKKLRVGLTQIRFEDPSVPQEMRALVVSELQNLASFDKLYAMQSQWRHSRNMIK